MSHGLSTGTRAWAVVGLDSCLLLFVLGIRAAHHFLVRVGKLLEVRGVAIRLPRSLLPVYPMRETRGRLNPATNKGRGPHDGILIQVRGLFEL